MTDELIEQVARVIYEEYDPWRTVWPWSDLQSDQAGVDQYRRIARAALAAINLPALTAWREAVIDELCSLHIYSAEHDDDPRKAVRDIIEWNQRLALDPAVSAEARALHTQGWNEAIEAAANMLMPANPVDDWTDYAKDKAMHSGRIRALTKENSDASSD